MSTQITLFKVVALLISNLDKTIIKTNISSCCLLIVSLSYFSFVIIVIFNTRTLLTSYIKIINIVSLSKTSNSNSSNRNYRDLLKLSYSLTNNLCFLKKVYLI